MLLQDQVELLQKGEAAVLEKDVARKYWIDLEYQQTMLRSEMGWIRSLQDQLRSGKLPW